VVAHYTGRRPETKLCHHNFWTAALSTLQNAVLRFLQLEFRPQPYRALCETSAAKNDVIDDQEHYGAHYCHE